MIITNSALQASFVIYHFPFKYSKELKFVLSFIAFFISSVNVAFFFKLPQGSQSLLLQFMSSVEVLPSWNADQIPVPLQPFLGRGMTTAFQGLETSTLFQMYNQ